MSDYPVMFNSIKQYLAAATELGGRGSYALCASYFCRWYWAKQAGSIFNSQPSQNPGDREYLTNQIRLCEEIKTKAPIVTQENGKEAILKFISEERKDIINMEGSNNYDELINRYNTLLAVIDVAIVVFPEQPSLNNVKKNTKSRLLEVWKAKRENRPIQSQPLGASMARKGPSLQPQQDMFLPKATSSDPGFPPANPGFGSPSFSPAGESFNAPNIPSMPPTMGMNDFAPPSFNSGRNDDFAPPSFNSGRNDNFTPPSFNSGRNDNFAPPSFNSGRNDDFAPPAFNSGRNDDFAPPAFNSGRHDDFAPSSLNPPMHDDFAAPSFNPRSMPDLPSFSHQSMDAPSIADLPSSPFNQSPDISSMGNNPSSPRMRPSNPPGPSTNSWNQPSGPSTNSWNQPSSPSTNSWNQPPMPQQREPQAPPMPEYKPSDASSVSPAPRVTTGYENNTSLLLGTYDKVAKEMRSSNPRLSRAIYQAMINACQSDSRFSSYVSRFQQEMGQIPE